MKITLKNIKYAAFASQETSCFEATIYLDGKRLCIVSNEGRGGCDDYQPVTTSAGDSKATYDTIRKIDSELSKETIKCSWIDEVTKEPATMPNSLESVVSGLLNDWHHQKGIKKILKALVYVKPDCEKGQYYIAKPTRAATTANIQLIKRAPWWDESNIILNELSISEAGAYL